jgi:hypothetical protein
VSDGLPRRWERRTARNIEGRFERDQPDDRIVSARYAQVRVDEEPPRGTFVYVPAAGQPAPETRGGGRRRGG